MKYLSRNWEANETTDLVGSKHTLTVTGQVEVRRANDTPKLTEASPQGINGKILILKVSVESGQGVGAEVLTWKDVSFSKEISPRQYNQVTITGDTDEQTVDVEEIFS